MKRYFSFLLIVVAGLVAGCSEKQHSQDGMTVKWIEDGNGLQKSQLFMELPKYCPTPDGLAIAPDGDLIVACPNFAETYKSACLLRINKNGELAKWLDVPVLEETGVAAPMGIAFADNGDLFICDNQGWTGREKGKDKGRILRLRFEANELVETITVASGMEHPNGICIRNGKVYVTQSVLSRIYDPEGLVSGIYCFDINDRDIEISNTPEDLNLIATIVTRNENTDIRYGATGIVFDEEGSLYVGNYGDATIHRITLNAAGTVENNEIWAQDQSQLGTIDGMCIDDKGNIWAADAADNAIARIDKNGTIERIAQNPDTNGSDGGLDQPGKLIVWNGMLVVSCFDMGGTYVVNVCHGAPYTLAKLALEKP